MTMHRVYGVFVGFALDGVLHSVMGLTYQLEPIRNEKKKTTLGTTEKKEKSLFNSKNNNQSKS